MWCRWTQFSNVLVIVLALFLFRDLYVKIRKLPKRPSISPLGPYNTTKYEFHDVNNQLIDLKNFTFKINPQPCTEYTAGLLLMILVSTNPINHEKRSAIRKTWGRSIDSTKIVFLVGESQNSTIAEKVYYESLIYGDIVEGNFVDAYRNMTYKHVMGLKWVALYCPIAKYVLKTDDDIFVNIDSLIHFLRTKMSPWGMSDLVGCQVIMEGEVLRSQSKWTVTKDEFTKEVYPPHCQGLVILYSQDVIPKLLGAAQSAPYFWIDDVHITGVLTEQLGIVLTSMNGIIMSDVPFSFHWLTLETSVKNAKRVMFSSHNVSAEQMTNTWLAMRYC